MSDENKSDSNNYIFSIVMAVYNVEKFLRDAIDSIINQSIGFEENVQLILIDDGSQDSSYEIALEYKNQYPNNIIAITKENGGVASARNLGIENATGKYVNFMDSDDMMDEEALEKVCNFFSEHEKDDIDVVAIPIKFFEAKRGNHPLNFKFKRERVVDVTQEPDYIQVVTNASFVKREALEGVEFDSKLFKMEDAFFINKLILKKKRYGLVDGVYYHYRKRMDESSITTGDGKYKKIFYTSQLKNFHKGLIDYCLETEGNVPDFIQNLIIYDLRWIVEVDLDSLYQIFDNDEEIEEFWVTLTDVLSYTSEDNILNHRVVPRNIQTFLIYVKNNDFHIDLEDDIIYFRSNDVVINRLNKRSVWIDIVDLKNGFLNISGSMVTNCESQFMTVEVIKEINGQKEVYKTETYDYYNTRHRNKKFLSIPWKFYYSFDSKVPVSKDEECKIYFKVNYKEKGIEKDFIPNLKFRHYAELSKYSHYYIRDNQIVLFYNANSFLITNYSFKKHFKYESRGLLKIAFDRAFGYKRGIPYRMMHFIARPFMKNKKIWIFSDRRDQSGDNGEHFFKYCVDIDDGVDRYFAIKKDSEDYPRLKQLYGNKVIPFGSFKHRWLYSFADNILSSHPDNHIVNPFRYRGIKLYSGMLTSRLYFLQHGVVKYNMSRWLRKYDHNVALLLTVSDTDYNAFIEEYNFDDDVIQELGFPRYDYLTNDNLKKQIVIIFTWRNYIKTEESLKNSEYFEKINSLINNEDLINAAKKYGYEVVVKPHPLMMKFIDIFDQNEYVKLDEVTKYHDIICDSALMITDYSSVAFDFAYLKKPILYYQYGDDFHFDPETSFFDDETDGFGRVIKQEDELVSHIIKYMENDCEMEDIYKERVDKFFKYTDRNNSKRVYDWIVKH